MYTMALLGVQQIGSVRQLRMDRQCPGPRLSVQDGVGVCRCRGFDLMFQQSYSSPLRLPNHSVPIYSRSQKVKPGLSFESVTGGGFSFSFQKVKKV